MSMIVIIGWWLVPLAVTIGSIIWTFWAREDERPTGSMFDGVGRVMGVSIRFFVATSVSLAAWLVWALLA